MSSTDFAVQALYSSHHGWLNTWLRARLGNAADLAQDTFVRLLQRTERLQFKSPRAFLRTTYRIARMLEGLKPKVRQAFLLVQCEGFTHKQIAEQMGLSLRSVERYVADALYHCYVLRYAA